MVRRVVHVCTHSVLYGEETPLFFGDTMNNLLWIYHYIKTKRLAKYEPVEVEVVKYDIDGLSLRDVEHLKRQFPVPRVSAFQEEKQLWIAEGRRQCVEYIERHLTNGRQQDAIPNTGSRV